MGFLSRIKRGYLEKTGKIKNKWPVVIRIYRKAGENSYQLSKVTRGRSLREEDGKIELEILDSPLKSSEVPYEYFTNRKDGVDELEIVRHTRESFSPLMKNIKVQETGENIDEDETGEVEKIYDLEQMKKTLVTDWENKVEISKNEDEHWIHDKRVQALIVFMGAGIFFVMLGIGYSKIVTKPLLEKVNQLDTASNILPVLVFTTRQKLEEVKNNL